MVDRIPGYNSGVIALTGAGMSRPVAGEALNQRVRPKKDRGDSGDHSSRDNGKDGGADAESVDIRIGGHSSGRAAAAYGAGARGRAPEREDDVVISHSTAVLLTEDLSLLIKRAVGNVGLLVHGLMSVPGTTAHDVERRFHIAALSAVRQAREQYLRSHGGAAKLPQGLAFEDISARYNDLTGAAEISIGRARFLDQIDWRATGVVFDVRGSAAVHDVRPGIFVDTGDDGAVIANTIIEAVRRGLPHFGGGEDTEGAVVLIRADKSDFSDHRSPAEWLVFDLIHPYSKV